MVATFDNGGRKMFKKLILNIYKLIIKLLKKLGITLNELIIEVTKIMLSEIKELDDMTIAELRNLAKANGISLEGKRVKGEIIEVIKKYLGE